jgi:hypothetical protein
MIAVGIWLLTIGFADLVAGLSGEPKPGRRTIAAVLSAFLLPAALAVVFGASVATVVVSSSLGGLSAAGWLALRRGLPTISETRAIVALLYLLAVFGIAALVAERPFMSFVSFEGPTIGERALAALPFEKLRGAQVGQVVFVSGVLVMLFSTSNAIVRLVLTAMGTRFSNAEQRLRGGRVIGPLERVLIFGLGLAGQVTAAALVIGAKGLLRYPELNNLRGEQGGAGGTSVRPIDVVTEYLLIGSLTSWLLALFPLVLMPT